MKEKALEKRASSSAVREKGQYAIGFSVIALMLFYAGFPVFLLVFLGILSFFVWKVFSTESRTETRRIFEFYLAVNEILRDDGRRWYGFEIQETIARGEAILRSMSTAPPLVYFGLGSLYQKLDDHSTAVKNLEQVVGDSTFSESAIVFPGKDLRDYVQMLRKIERFPAEAPLTSSAIRSLERARKNRGQEILDLSRKQLENGSETSMEGRAVPESIVTDSGYHGIETPRSGDLSEEPQTVRSDVGLIGLSRVPKSDLIAGSKTTEIVEKSDDGQRKTISEVLHDIYDNNIQ